jgi:hypothetical protein
VEGIGVGVVMFAWLRFAMSSTTERERQQTSLKTDYFSKTITQRSQQRQHDEEESGRLFLASEGAADHNRCLRLLMSFILRSMTWQMMTSLEDVR